MGNRSSVFILGEGVKSNNIVSLWKVSKDQPLMTLAEHTSAISCVRFSWDDKHAFSSDLLGTVIQWDPSSCRSLRSFYGHTRGVTQMAMDHSALFASGGLDSKIKLWDCREKNSIGLFRLHE